VASWWWVRHLQNRHVAASHISPICLVKRQIEHFITLGSGLCAMCNPFVGS
jgi:hypothetical protein